MIVERTQPSVLIIEGIILKPALNVLNEDATKKLLASPVFKQQCGNIINGKPAIRVYSSKKSDQNSANVAESISEHLEIPKNADEKIELIEQCLDYDSLALFAEGEKRKAVLKAIEKQKAKLTDHRKDESENEEG